MTETLPSVYICGPYRKPNVMLNIAIAVEHGLRVYHDAGAVPLIPHLSGFVDFYKPHSEDFWLEFTLHQMLRCDAVYRYSMNYSEGADLEVKAAELHSIPVFYDLVKLADWVKDWKEWKAANGRSLSNNRNNPQGVADV